jgi:predicted NBD/HSP70 family sugar kinase
LFLIAALGTGIGMGLIIENKLYSGAHGLIEGGHMVRNEFIFVECTYIVIC